MKTYHISLNIKTPQGKFEAYGKFELGDDKEFAISVFERLKGDDEVSEKSVLHMDLTEYVDGFPFVLNAKHCTLEELAANTKRISCDIFKRCALDGNDLAG